MSLQVENSTPSSPVPKLCVPAHACANRFLVFASLAATVAPMALADTATTAWNGGTTNWATSANWNSGLPSATLSALFNSGFSTQPQLTANATVQGLYLASGVGKDVTITAPDTNNAANIDILTLTGTATLGGQANAGIMLDDSSNHSLTIGSLTNQINVKLNNSTGFYVNNAGTLALTGAKLINLNGCALTLGGTHAAGKIILDKEISGSAGSLVINTAGTVTLSGGGSGLNAHTGGTTLNAGTLNINCTKAFGAASSTFTVNGGVIDNTSGAAITTANANPLNFAADVVFAGGGSGTEHDLTFSAAATTLNGAAGARTVTVVATNSTLGIQGAIGSGTATGLTKAGAGTLTLSGLNTYTGATTVNGGVLRLNNTNAVPGGILAKGGSSALTLNGGVVELTANSGPAFNRDLGSGAEQVQITGGASGFSSIAASGRTVNFNGDGHTITWGAPAFNPSVLVLQEASATVDTLTLANPIDLGAGERTVAVKASTAALSGPLSGAGGSLIKIGEGTLSLTSTNSYGGSTTVNAGTLKFTDAMTGSGPMSVHSNATLMLAKASGFMNTNLSITVNNGGVLRFGSSDNFGTVSSASINNAPAITINAGGTVSAGAFENSLYNLTLSGGTLSTTDGLSANNWGAYNLGGTVTVGGAAASAITGDGSPYAFFNLSTAGTTFNVGDVASGPDLTVSCPIGTGGNSSKWGPSGALVKTGPGTMLLTTNNLYNGTTTISNGTLQVDGSIASSSVTIATNAVLCGFGTLGSNVTVGAQAMIAAGTTNSIGSATIAGTLTLLNNSKLLVNVQPGLADKISVTGGVTTAGTIYLEVRGTPPTSRRLTVLQCSGGGTISGSGTFSVISEKKAPKVIVSLTKVELLYTSIGTLIAVF